MIVFPAIDLKDGQCVRLVQGKADDQTIYSSAPAEVARRFQQAGARWLHIVDLDGAFSGKPSNLKAIEAIADEVSIPFQVGEDCVESRIFNSCCRLEPVGSSSELAR